MTTQAEIRDEFWRVHPRFERARGKRDTQNLYHVDIRTAFCDFVDSLARAGEITEDLAARVTL